MKKILITKFLIFFSISLFCFSFFSSKINAAASGCCRFEVKENNATVGEYCYSFNNNQTNFATGKTFKQEDCQAMSGSIVEEGKICVDLYYSQTDPSIIADKELPIQGVKCIDNPKITELQDVNKRGVLSKDCLDVNGKKIEDCLVSSFFPDIGLPGSSEASTNPDAVRSLLLTKVGLVIGLVLGAVGIIFLITIIYAGIQWLIADDSEKKVAESKEILRNAVIGLIITMFAYGLSYFIFNALAKVS